jgi:hypothetical protein
MKKLSLKKLKFHEDMSEETPCFSADLYEDGVLMAHVRNAGRGGGNDLRAVKGKTYKEVAHLDNMDVECDVMQLAEDMNFTKKNQTKGFVLKKGNNYYTQKFPRPISKLKKASNYNSWMGVELIALEKDGYEVLNTNL